MKLFYITARYGTVSGGREDLNEEIIFSDDISSFQSNNDENQSSKDSRMFRLMGTMLFIILLSSILITTVKESTAPRRHSRQYSDADSVDTPQPLQLSAPRVFYSNLSEEIHVSMFDQFLREYKKEVVVGVEYSIRLQQFCNNLAVIDKLNMLEISIGSDVVHGITKFADVSLDYFKRHFLGFRAHTLRATHRRYSNDVHMTGTVSTKDIAYLESSSADWTGIYTTPIKDQGRCGSCWAFTVIEQLESDIIRNFSIPPSSISLSTQQLVSCDTAEYGCQGGDNYFAFNYIRNSGGVESESEYPYVSGQDGLTGACAANQSLADWTLTEYYTLPNEEAMARYVLTTGPLSVCVDATNWPYYESGVFMGESCGRELNHCVQLVGINLNSSPSYWIVSSRCTYSQLKDLLMWCLGLFDIPCIRSLSRSCNSLYLSLSPSTVRLNIYRDTIVAFLTLLY